MRVQLVTAKILYHNGLKERKVFTSPLTMYQYIGKHKGIVNVSIVDSPIKKVSRILNRFSKDLRKYIAGRKREVNL